jgi:ribosomal protein L37AE/L43A
MASTRVEIDDATWDAARSPKETTPLQRHQNAACKHCGAADVRLEWPIKVCGRCGTVLERVAFNAHAARKRATSSTPEGHHPTQEDERDEARKPDESSINRG